jgi:hypothetical protein
MLYSIKTGSFDNNYSDAAAYTCFYFGFKLVAISMYEATAVAAMDLCNS